MKLTPMKAVVLTAGVVSAQIALAVPPTDDPCGLAVSFFCRFVPIAPELDGDVDLTTQVPPADPAAPPPDSLPPGNVCTMGCL